VVLLEQKGTFTIYIYFSTTIFNVHHCQQLRGRHLAPFANSIASNTIDNSGVFFIAQLLGPADKGDDAC
jgi:hypothetical protein